MEGHRGVDTARYGLVIGGTVCYTSLTFSWFSLAAYLPVIIDELGLSGSQAGLLAGAVPLTYVPLGLVSGLLVDRIGPVWSLALGVAIVGGGQLGRSLAPGFPTLLASTLLLGVGGTAITFGLPKLVGVLFPADAVGVPTSIYLVGSSAGSVGAFALGRPVFGPFLGGWRPLFRWTALAVLGYVVVWLFAARLSGLPVADDQESETLTRSTAVRDLRTILTHRDMRLLVIVATAYLLVSHGMQNWLPTILEARGLGPSFAGQTTSLFVLASLGAVLVVPALAERFRARRAAVVGCGVLGTVGIAGVVLGGVGPLVVVGIALAGAATGGLSPLVRAIPPDLDGVGAKLTGTAMGFAFAVGEIGGFTGPFVVGALFDATGTYAVGLSVLAIGTIVVVVAGTAMRQV